MKYEEAMVIADDKFKRLTGLKRAVYDLMVSYLKEKHKEKMKEGGRPPKLLVEDQLLITLQYLRENRTYAAIGGDFKVSESSAFKTIRWVEDTLAGHPALALPGKKTLVEEPWKYTAIIVDATETPIERPKKNNINTTLEKRKDTP